MKIRIPHFRDARVLVIGDIMLDRYWHGATNRVSMEAPVPIVHVQQLEDRLGGAGNVALNISALGASATVLAVTGSDEAGATLQELLNGAEIDSLLVRDPSVPTITKLRIISRHQQLLRMDFEQDLRGCDDTALINRFHQQLDQCDVVVCSDYNKGTLRQVNTLISAARAAGKPVLVDPKGHDFSAYRGASLITPNMTEFELIVGPCRNEQELVAKGTTLLAELELGALLITRGEQGMSLLRPGEEPLHLPTHAREVFDVTGAGDTVISVLAAGIAAGLELPQATALANLAAGIVVGKLGTATATVAELERSLHRIEESELGIVTEEELLERVRVARAHGERLVMTNGCFDLLHAGHVAYLNQARRLGDRLIVAVNDDASVTRLKGSGRPVNHLRERMEVLAGLSSVDWVVPFSEDTPERLICSVLPDLLVKGGDYQPEQIAGYDCVTAAGGEVRVLEFRPGCSTTSIIESLTQS